METISSTLKFVASGGNATDASNAADIPISQAGDFASYTSGTADFVLPVVLFIAAIIAVAISVSFLMIRKKAECSATRYGQTRDSYKKPLVATIISIVLALSCAAYMFSSQKNAFAEDSNNNLSVTDIVATVNLDTQDITFSSGMISNESTSPYTIKQTSLIKKDSIDDGSCVWTLNGNDVLLYSGQSWKTSKPQTPQSQIDINSQDSVSLTLSQNGMSFDTAKSLIDKDVLEISFDVEKKVDDQYKLLAKGDVNAQAEATIAAIDDMSYLDNQIQNDSTANENKEAYKQKVRSIQTSANNNIDLAQTYDEVDTYKETGIREILEVENVAALQNLSNAKSQLQAELADIYTNSNTIIDQCHNLTKDVRENGDNSYKKQLENEYISAISNICDATTVSDVESAKDDGVFSLNTITEDAQKVNEKSYWKVVFDVNGHGKKIDPVKDQYQWDNSVYEPQNPEESGWTFLGWYKENTCNTQWDFSNDKIGDNIACNADACTMTLFAKWTNKLVPKTDDFQFVAPTNLEYDGKAKVASFTGKPDGMGEITVKYANSLSTTSSEWTVDAPVNVDTYYVMASISEGQDYIGIDLTSDEWKFVVTPYAITPPTSKADLVYNGTTQTGVEIPEGENNYSLSGYTTGKNADTYTATAVLKDKNNYVWSATSTSDDYKIVWSIARKAVTVRVDDKTKSYDEKDPEFSAKVDGVIATESPSIIEYILSRKDGDDVGNYEIIADGSTIQGNYEVAYVPGELQIYPASVSAPKPNTTLVYTGGLQTGVKAADNEKRYTLSGQISGTNVGTYTAKATLTDKKNYLWDTGKADDVDIEWSIAPKDVTVTPDYKSKFYGEDDPQLTATVFGVVDSCEIEYDLKRGEGEDAKTYEIKATGNETQGNYKVTFNTGIFTINPAEIEVPSAVSGLEYNGVEQTGVVADSKDRFTLRNNKAKNAGTYEATASLSNKNNYIWKTNTGVLTSDNQIIAWEIARKLVTVTAEDKWKFYGETDPQLTVKVDGTIGDDTVFYTLTRDQGEDANNYWIFASGDAEQGNYRVTFVDGAFIIHPAIVDVPEAIFGLVYSGEEQIGVSPKDKDKNKYELTDAKAVNAGKYTAKASLYDKKNYVWNASLRSEDQDISWSIDKKSIEGANIEGIASSYIYDGKVHRPEPTKVTIGDINVSSDSYKCEFPTDGDYKSVGEYEVKICTLEGTNFKDDISQTFRIVDLEEGLYISFIQDQVYDGSEIRPEIFVFDKSGNQLHEKEYSVEYSNNINVGNYASVYVKGLTEQYKQYYGEQTFKINKRELTVVNAKVDNKTYDGIVDASVTNEGDLKGVISGTDVKIDKVSAKFEDANAGTDKKVKLEYTLSGNDAANYYVTSPNYVQANINPVEIDVPEAVSGLIYTASEQKGVYSKSDKYDLKDNTGINARSYTATATLKDKINYVWSNDDKTSEDQSIPWQIQHKSVTVEAKNSQKTYGQNDPMFEATVTGLLGEDSVIYAISREAGENAGEYKILLSGDATQGNYAVTYYESTFTIYPAEVELPKAIESLVYTGEEQTGVISEDTDKYTLTDAKAVDAGEHIATASLTSTTNYVWRLTQESDNQKIKWSIGQKSITGAKVEGISSSYEYTGEKIQPRPTSVTIDGLSVPDTNYECLYPSDGNYTDSGIYEIKILANGNFKDYVSQQFLIVKLDNNLIIDEIPDQTYNAQEIKPSIVVKDKSGKTLTEGIDYTKFYFDNIKAGKAKVCVTGITNPYIGCYGDQKFNIAKRELTVVGAEVQSKNYDGNVDATVLNAGWLDNLVDGDDVAINDVRASFDNANVGNDKKISFVYKLFGTDATNYSVKNPEDVAASIYPVKVDIPKAQSDLKYNGNEQTGVYSKDDNTYTLSGNKGTEAGDYTATATLNNWPNYVWNTSESSSRDLNIRWQIQHRPVTVAAESKSKIYCQTDPKLTVSVTGTINEDDKNNIIYKISRENGEDAGIYTITPTGNEIQGNYKVSYNVALFTINPARVEVPKANSGLTYNGQLQIGVDKPKGEKPLYELIWNTGTDAGDYTAIAQLIDIKNYVWDTDESTFDDQEIEWSIGQKSIKGAEVTGIESGYKYTGEKIQPRPTSVIIDGLSVPSESYKCEYPSGGTYIEPGLYEVKISASASGNFKDSVTRSFSIYNFKNDLKIGLIPEQTYNGKSIEPNITVTDSEGTQLDENQYYTSYSNNTTVGQATVTVVGIVDPYIGSCADANFTINKKELSIEGAQVEDKTFDGKKDAKVKDKGTLNGVVAGEIVDFKILSAEFDNANAGTDKNVNLTYEISGKDSGNYSITNPVVVSADINPVKVDVPKAQSGLRYDGNELTGVNPDTDKRYILTGNTGKNAGDYKAVAELSDKTNYVWNTSESSSDNQVIKWSIERRIATVTAKDNSKTYKEKDPALSAEVKNLVPGDSIKYDVKRKSGENVGFYAITPTGEETQGNYQVKFEDGKFTIYAAKIDVPQAQSALTYNAQEQTGVIGGEGYELSNNTATNAGDYTAIAILKDKNNFVWSGKNTADDVEVPWSIQRAKATVQAKDSSKTYGESDPELEAEEKGVFKGDTIEYKVTRDSGTNAGKYTIHVEGEKEQNNYNICYIDGIFIINKAQVEIPKAVEGLVYNGDYQTGVNSDEDKKYTLENFTAKDAGDYTATASLTNKNNYMWSTLTSIDQDISWKIARKSVTVTANNVSKIYGGKDPELTVDISGLVSGDSIIYKVERKAGEDYGTYPITVSGEKVQGNYTVSYVNGEFTIYALKVKVPKAVEKTLTYNTKEQTGVEMPEGEDKYTLNGNKATNAGSYTATATLTNKNYVWDIDDPTSKDQKIKWSIEKKSIKDADVKGIDLSYEFDGKAHLPKPTSVKTDDGIEVPNTSYTCTYPTGKPELPDYYTDPGYYEVKISANENSNFKDDVSQWFYIVEYNNDLTITLKSNNFIYDGKAHEPEIIVTDGYGKTLKENDQYSKVFIDNVNAGNHAHVVVTGIDKYLGYYGMAQFSIAQKELTVEDVEVCDKIYDGNDNAEITNKGKLVGVIDKDKDKVEIGNCWAWFDDVNAGKNKSVNATYEDPNGDAGDNYYITDPDYVKATINPAPVEVPKAVSGLVYSGKEQTGVKLPQEESRYTLKDNTATNAGEHTATASLINKNNYIWNLDKPAYNDQQIKWNIDKAKQEVNLSTREGSVEEGLVLDVGFTLIGDPNSEYSIWSDDSSTATATVDKSKNKIQITGIKPGDTCINVKVGDTSNYKESSVAIFKIHVDVLTEFYAVFNKAQKLNVPANTLSFYYDRKKFEHNLPTETVYDKFPMEARQAGDWTYDSIRSDVENVLIDSTVTQYKDLKSTAYMFYDMKNSSNISGCEFLNTSNVTDMTSTFDGYGSQSVTINTVPDVSKWDTSKVTSMAKMFHSYASAYTTNFNLVPDVAEWDTSKVTDMFSMFDCYAAFSTSLNLVPNVSKWNTSQVVDFSSMFSYYGSYSERFNSVPDVSNWDTYNVCDMRSMFSSYASNSVFIEVVPEVRRWNTSNVTNMSAMFYNYAKSAKSIIAVPDVSSWNTSNVADMSRMFAFYASSSELIKNVPEVSSWSTSNVENMSYMFQSYAAQSPLTLTALNLCEWDITSLYKLPGMFQSYAASNPDEDNKRPIIYAADWKDIKPDGVNAINMFKDSKLKGQTSGDWESASTRYQGCFSQGAQFYAVYNWEPVGKIAEYTLSFYYDTDKDTHKSENETVYDNLTINAQKAEDWGYDLIRSKIQNVCIDSAVSKYDDLLSIAYMFSDMVNVNSLTGFEYLNTRNVTNMSSTFAGFGSESEKIQDAPNVSTWAVDNVTTMSSMFYNYASNSKNFSAVPNVSNWHTDKVSDMSDMFNSYACSSSAILQKLNLAYWSIESLSKAYSMFYKYAAGNTSAEKTVIWAQNWTDQKSSKDVKSWNMFTESSLKGYIDDDWDSANTSDSGCFSELYIPVEQIDLDKDMLELWKDDGYKLTASVIPDNATNKGVKWQSADEKIASVDDEGFVRAKSFGETKIYAHSEENTKIYDICSVIVWDQDFLNPIVKTVDNEDIVFLPSYPGETPPCDFFFKEEDNTYSKIEGITDMSSLASCIAEKGSDKSTLKNVYTNAIEQNFYGTTLRSWDEVFDGVDSSGYAKGLNKDFEQKLSDAHVGTIYRFSDEQRSAWDALNAQTATNNPTPRLNTVAYGTDPNNKDEFYGSYHNYLCYSANAALSSRVDQNNTAYCWYVDKNYWTLSDSRCAVLLTSYYNNPVTEVSLDKDNINLKVYEKDKLTATIKPDDATDKSVTWSSSNEEIATVDENGVVTAHNIGEAVITVTTNDRGLKATCSVKVEDAIHVTDVKLDQTKIDLDYGQNWQLTATVLPEDATNKDVTWFSYDEEIVSVDASGLVTANNSEGSARVEVRTVDKDKTAECIVNVHDSTIHVTNVKFNETDLDLEVGKTGKLIAIVEPSNATDKSVIWSSDNEDVATVDDEGNVTAKKLGEATIMVTTFDGAFTAECRVHPYYSSVTQVTNIPYENSKKSIQNVNFVPAFADNNSKYLQDNGVKYYLNPQATIEDTEINDLIYRDDGCTMSQLCDKLIDEKYKVRTLYVNASSDIDFYAVVDETWEDVFGSDISSEYPKNLNKDGSLYKNLLTDSIGTVYFNGKDGTELQTKEHWSVTDDEKTSNVCPTLNGVSYSNESEANSTFYYAYKDILSKVPNAFYPWSSRSYDANSAYSWSALSSSWGKSEKSVAAGVALTLTIPARVPVEGVSLDKDEVNLQPNNSVKLTATITPENATDKLVAWKSEDEDVATVDDQGNVLAKNCGGTTIIVKTNDGSCIATCKVNVTNVPVVRVTNIPYTNKSGTPQNVNFVPAFADNNPKYLQDNGVKYYLNSQATIEDTEINDLIYREEGCTMSQLYEALKDEDGNIKTLYAAAISGVKFYAVVDDAWYNVFNDKIENYHPCGLNKSGTLYKTFLTDNISTIYFEGKDGTDPLRDENWSPTEDERIYDVPPKLNGVYFSRGTDYEDSTFYNSYGKYNGGILSKSSQYMFSSSLHENNYEIVNWCSTSVCFWTASPREDKGALFGTVLCMTFPDRTSDGVNLD